MFRLGWLDQWRVAATLYLVLYHAVLLFKNNGQKSSSLLELIAGKGYLGTSFFMILSGFIITLIYKSKIGDHKKNSRFWLSRFARIGPPYFILVSAVIFKSYFIDKDWILNLENVIDAIGNITLITSLSPKISLYLPQAWTLGVLILFYAMFPWLCRKLTSISTQGLTKTAVALWIIYLMVPVIYLSFAHEGVVGPYAQEPTIFSYLHKFPILRVVEPLLGMLMALYLTTSQGLKGDLYQNIYWCSWLILGAVIFLPNDTFFFPLLHNGLCLPLILTLIATRYRISQLIVDKPVSKLVKVLADATLGVYLSHIALLSLTTHLDVKGVPNDVAILVSVILVTALGMLMQIWVFRPLGDQLAKWIVPKNNVSARVVAIGD